MFDSFMSSVYGSSDSLVASISTVGFLECSLASILLGVIVAFIYMFKHTYSKNFVVTLALLPLIVQMVIVLVNGNLGAGIAVMGVFNLVRFRSIPGSAKDIAAVFLAMAVGLATGMGFIALAILFVIIVAIANTVYTLSPLGKTQSPKLSLKVTLPEDREFDGPLTQIMEKYTSEYSLDEIKTASMGSLYVLDYSLRMKEQGLEKAFIDELRCYNGNLKIVLNHAATKREVL